MAVKAWRVGVSRKLFGDEVETGSGGGGGDEG